MYRSKTVLYTLGSIQGAKINPKLEFTNLLASVKLHTGITNYY